MKAREPADREVAVPDAGTARIRCAPVRYGWLRLPSGATELEMGL